MKAFKKDIANIDGLYEGRKPFYGELHDHSACGDGKNTLAACYRIEIYNDTVGSGDSNHNSLSAALFDAFGFVFLALRQQGCGRIKSITNRFYRL